MNDDDIEYCMQPAVCIFVCILIFAGPLVARRHLANKKRVKKSIGKAHTVCGDDATMIIIRLSLNERGVGISLELVRY